jgi:2-methylcitrate dehydratase PrpD
MARSFPAGTTKAVVDFISNASFDRMPQKVVDEAKRCLIDGFGVVLAGATVRGSAIVREYIKAAGAQTDATVLGPEKVSASAAHAALANGASGHAMDYDDTQLSTTPDRVFGLLTHPTVPALAAALAVGERLNVSDRTFLEAF